MTNITGEAAPTSNQVVPDKHPLEDMPAFDPDSAKRAKETNEDDEDKIINTFSGLDSIDKKVKSKSHILECERILSAPSRLQEIGAQYLEQYDGESETDAETLFSKELLDHYVVDQLSGSNAKKFIESEEFSNYSSYLVNMARQKTQTIGGKRYWPEIATNPVLSNPEYRRLVISKVEPGYVDAITKNLAASEAKYRKLLTDIEKRLDEAESVSQEDLNAAGDYLYTSRDFGSNLAVKFVEYIFNEAYSRPDLKSSTQISGALANYFAYDNDLDKRLQERRVIVTDNLRRGDPVNVGVSTKEYCAIGRDYFNKMSLTSDEGLKKSRWFGSADLYSLMMVTYHELTHDYQKLMVLDGKDNSSAMSQILNVILRENPSTCFPLVDKNLNKVLDENGNEVKTSYYRANHDNDEIEIQADEEAWRQCRKFTVRHERWYKYKRERSEDEVKRHNRHYGQCIDNEKEVRNRRAFALKFDENGQKMPYIKYDIQQLSQNIKDRPTLIDKFPQLAKFFDRDGKIKPSTFFDKEIAKVDSIGGFDTITDDFGVEFTTYAITSDTIAKRIRNYVEDPSVKLSGTEINNCLNNIWNTLHQNVLKTRLVDKVNFDNYDHTKTVGKDISVEDIKKYYLKMYVHQLYNCMNIAESLRTKYPQVDERISKEEKTYYLGYFVELSKGVTMPPEYWKKIKEIYSKSKNATIQKIAGYL